VFENRLDWNNFLRNTSRSSSFLSLSLSLLFSSFLQEKKEANGNEKGYFSFVQIQLICLFTQQQRGKGFQLA
jgi:hypothetical protein